MDLSSFHQQIPIKVKELFNEIVNENFLICLVGGITRDFLLYQKVGNDFDCEVRPKDQGDISHWENVKSKLLDHYDAQELKFNVIRIKLTQEIEVELTLPRLEKFDGTRGHSNFEADFIADLDYSQGYIRRDFTINAIYFQFDGSHWTIKDPASGLEDIENKCLKQSSHAFSMDPIRFLRAFRFKVNLSFQFSSSLTEVLETMPLEGMGHFYFKYETSKCRRPILMIKKMSTMRPELFNGDHIRQENKELVLWDNFYIGDLKSHIKQAVIVPVQFRSVLCQMMNFSQKNLLPSIRFSESWHSLITYGEESETFKAFFDTLSSLEKLNILDEKMTYLLEYYDFSMDLETFKRFTQIDYQLKDDDLKSPKSLYKYIIFKSRLKAL